MKHRLQPVSIGILEVDDDDVRVELCDSPRKAVHVVDDRHPLMARFAQPLLDDRGAHAVFVDDEDSQTRRWHGVTISTARHFAMQQFLPSVHLDFCCNR